MSAHGDKPPPKSGKERIAAYRQRLKDAGLHDQDKAQAKLRMRARRNALSQRERRVCRKADAERKRRARAAAKRQQTAVAGGIDVEVGAPYKTVQTQGKAVARAKRSLPQCPIKREVVLTAIAKDCNLTIHNPRQIAAIASARRSNCLDPDTENTVVAFYSTSEISWQSPSMKDRIIVRHKVKGGVNKTYIPKRFLLMSLQEAYAAFKSAHSDIEISFSKFCSLKPVEVDVFGHMPHNVCVCIYHENMRLLLEALSPFAGLPKVFREMLENVTCSQENYNCMMRKCKLCEQMAQGFNPENYVDEPDSVRVSVEQWKRENGNKTEKLTLSWSLAQCFDEFLRQLTPFCRHVYLKRAQAASFQEALSAVDGRSMVLQMDFAENFSLIQQHEVQSGHWAHSMCTIFTAHVWKDSDTSQGYIFVSDELDREKKTSVYKLLDTLLDDLRQTTDVTAVTIFTDGAASQFKQRYVLSLLPVFEQRYGVTLSWEFFATGHGKGVVDGHGADVKGAVWRRIRCGATLKCAEDFADVAKQACPKLKVSFIPKEDIRDNYENLREHWETVSPIPNILGSHVFRCLDYCHLVVSEYHGGPEKNVRIM